MSRRADVVALVVGVLLTGLALAALWNSLVAPLTWALLKVVVPIVLVAVGVVGLALSCHR